MTYSTVATVAEEKEHYLMERQLRVYSARAARDSFVEQLKEPAANLGISPQQLARFFTGWAIHKDNLEGRRNIELSLDREREFIEAATNAASLEQLTQTLFQQNRRH
jgi:membrane-bound lytic murein transglycosylase B